ncbi:MAG: hypothetical protein JXQ96_22065 [Cyclobacteriaceae bacterium]
MKKSTRIITVVLSAALTFGALYVTLGKDFRKSHFERHGYECLSERETKPSTD